MPPQLVQQAVALVLVERFEQGGCRVPFAAAPAWSLFEQFRPGHTEQEDWCVARQVADLFHQIEERLRAPVQIVEHADDGPFPSFLFKQLAECPGDRLRVRFRLALPEQRADRRRGLVPLRDRVELLDGLDDRPVGDPVAIGKAAAARDLGVETAKELGRQSRLADAGAPKDREQLAGAVLDRSSEGDVELGQFVLTSDHRRRSRSLNPAAQREQLPGRYRFRLSFQLERPDRGRVDRVSHQLHRRRPEQHLPRFRRLLETCCDVEGVSGRQALRRTGHDLAAVDADPRLQSQLRQCFTHLERRTHRPQRIVFMRYGNPEDRHHRIADELVDGTAVRFDDRFHPFEEVCEQRARRLGVDRLSECRRTDDIAEHHRHDLALHVFRSERCCAVRAVRKSLLALPPATRADHRIADARPLP
jgi:hypothetical protein